MAFKLANRVKMTVSGTPGTGSITLGSAITGYVSFAAGGIVDGDTVSYVIEDTGSAWEIGVGTYTASGTVLARTSVTASSAGGTTKISATSAALVFVAPLAADLQSTDTLTSGTLPVSRGGTGITSLGTGVATFLGTPSSANLASAVTDETGSGALVFGTSPTITTGTLTGLKETKTAPSISSGTLTLDCSVGNVFAVSLNAAITTLSFTNVPSSGTAYALTLSFTADGTARAVTWGSAVKWPGGTAPTLTSTNGKVDTFVLTTWDGGTTWYAFTAGQNS